MLLKEIFDKEQAMKDFKKDADELKATADTESSKGDMIVSEFEAGKLSYDQAKQKLTAAGEGVWMHELNMAAELKDGKKKLN